MLRALRRRRSPCSSLPIEIPMAAKKKVNPALMKPVQPDEVLAVIVGSAPLPRGQITKKLWDYIKKNGLQDTKVKTNIKADEKLKPIFGGKAVVTMFEMTKLVSKHIKA
jgi:upstream activation factor subunit UAF30